MRRLRGEASLTPDRWRYALLGTFKLVSLGRAKVSRGPWGKSEVWSTLGSPLTDAWYCGLGLPSTEYCMFNTVPNVLTYVCLESCLFSSLFSSSERENASSVVPSGDGEFVSPPSRVVCVPV